MKHSYTRPFILTILYLLIGCSSQSSSGNKKELNQHHKFIIEGCTITYNEKGLVLGEDISSWIDVLGSNYRQGGASRRYIWDKIGIYANTNWKDYK